MNDYWFLFAFALILVYYISVYDSIDEMATQMPATPRTPTKHVDNQKNQKYFTYRNKFCGYNHAQLDGGRGELVPNDQGHSFYTTYNFDQLGGDPLEFCKQKCEDNPRCGTFVTNFSTNQCHINEKIKNHNLICTASNNTNSYVRENTLCEHEKMQHWYCKKDFGHRYWN